MCVYVRDNNRRRATLSSHPPVRSQAQQSGAGDAEAQQRALADPEIQQILTDPMIQQVLKEMREQPEAAQGYLRDERIRAKLNKLIAAGILRTK